MKMGIVSDENWIAALPPRIRDAIWARCSTIQVAVGQEFSQAGNPPDAMFQVATGYLRLTAFQPDGRNLLIAIYSPGNCFAESAVVARRPLNHTTVALTAASVRRLPTDDFWELYEIHSEIPDALCRKFAYSMGRQIAGREIRATNRLGKCVALMFENLITFCGKICRDGSVVIPLPLTQSDIADHLDVTRQSVQPEITALKEAGVLEKRGDWIVKDVERLRNW